MRTLQAINQYQERRKILTEEIKLKIDSKINILIIKNYALINEIIINNSMDENLNSLISFNEDCFNFVAPKLDAKKEEEFDLFGIEYLSLNFCYRMIHSLRAVNLLLPKLENNGYHSSIALILRPSLLDLLTFGYVLNQMQEEKTEKLEIIKSIYIDNLKNIFYDFNRFKSTGDYSLKEYKSNVESIHKKFGGLFKKFEFQNNSLDFEFVDLPKLPSARKIYSSIKGTNQNGIKNIANCYHEYSWFSKYEHFGLITVMLMNGKGNTFRSLLKKSCKNIARGANTGLLFLGGASDELKKRINSFNI